MSVGKASPADDGDTFELASATGIETVARSVSELAAKVASVFDPERVGAIRSCST